jgi:hypothetical protein
MDGKTAVRERRGVELRRATGTKRYGHREGFAAERGQRLRRLSGVGSAQAVADAFEPTL